MKESINKTKNKRLAKFLISILVTGIISIILLLNSTNFVKAYSVGDIITTTYYANSWGAGTVGIFVPDTGNGDLYCIEKGNTWETTKFRLLEYTRCSNEIETRKLQAIVGYGGNTKWTWAKQFALWMSHTGLTYWGAASGYHGVSYPSKDSVTPIVEYADNYAIKNPDAEAPSIEKLSNCGAEFIEDTTCKIGPFVLKYDVNGIYNIKNIKVYSNSGEELTIAKYQDSKGNDITQIPNANKEFYIVLSNVDEENTQGIKSVELTYDYTDYSDIKFWEARAVYDNGPTEDKWNHPQRQILVEGEVKSGQEKVKFDVDITFGTKWSVVLYKTDMDNKEETTKGIAGATFRVKLKTKNGETTKDYTTAVNGEYNDSIIWGNIAAGETQTLEVTEIVAPAGYVKLNGTVIVTIKCDEDLNVTMSATCSDLTYSYDNTDDGEYRFNTREDNRGYLKFYDRPEGKYNIQIVKVDEDTEKRLSGAKFTLNGTEMSVTNSEGITTSADIIINNVGTDVLTIEETAQPEDYQSIGNIKLEINKELVDNKYKATEVKITQNPNNCTAELSGNTIILKVPNKRIVKDGEYYVKIVKQDNINGAKLSGARFSLNGTAISGATNANGVLMSEKIIINSEGTDQIIISEIEAPEDYQAIDDIKLAVTKAIVDYKYTVTDIKITENQNDSIAEIKEDTIILTIPNKRKTIKLSGYVWEDEKQGKESALNGQKDSNEKPVENVQVFLHTAGDSIYPDNIWETKTNSNGYYEFEVPIGASYYVEFKYNGYNYQHTKYTKYTGTASPITSNATETERTRDSFNNRLAQIGPNTTISNVKVSNKDNELSATDLGTNDIYAISAYVGSQGEENTTKFNDTAENINLGITKRETADLALRKDVYKATTTIKGYTQDYIYNKRNLTTDEEGNKYWDISQRASDIYYNEGYTREIKQSDYNYSDADQNKNLKLYVTYIITIRNQSGVLDSKVRSVAEYYDEDYTYVEGSAYLGDRSGNKISDVAISAETISPINGYKQRTITGLDGNTLKAGDDLYVYITFSVGTGKNIKLDEDNGKGNMAEILGYSTYYGEKATSPNSGNSLTYTEYKKDDIAGRIDVDSNPGNATSMDESKFEDDTDRAPYVKVKLSEEERATEGYVWEDARTNEVGDAVVGNGIRDDGEALIDGIKVELWDKDTNNIAKIYNGTTWVDARTETSNGGKYSITGFVPGNYYVKFIYGENAGEYNGQDYKSTTYVGTKVDTGFTYNNPDELDRFVETDTLYSDARDIYGNETTQGTREYVTNIYSGEMTNPRVTNLSENISAAYMQAKTGIIEVYIEKGGNNIAGLTGVEQLSYKFENVDFGLQERPKAQLMLSKEVSNVKVVLSNGNVLFDNGSSATNLTWQDKKYHTNSYNGKLMSEPIRNNNAQAILLTMDEELMHGSTIKITYKVKVENIGEVDYASKEFYYAGSKNSSDTPITTMVGKVIDYAGAAGTDDLQVSRNNLLFDISENAGWTAYTLDKIYNYQNSKTNDLGLVSRELLNKAEDYTGIVSQYSTILVKEFNKELTPKIVDGAESSVETSLVLTQVMTSEESDQKAYNNIAEIVSFQNGIGRRMEYSIVGNQNPDEPIAEVDSDMAQSVTILPPFGQTYIYYILGGVVAIIAAAGIVLIKIKVLKSRE